MNDKDKDVIRMIKINLISVRISEQFKNVVNGKLLLYVYLFIRCQVPHGAQWICLDTEHHLVL